jgi:hypothetical protein
MQNVRLAERDLSYYTMEILIGVITVYVEKNNY